MSNVYFYKLKAEVKAELNALRKHDETCALRRERYLASCTCGLSTPPKELKK